ncbi:hypothetical protein ATCC90586_005593 [Pythium insidiosum]|nr:hypothetical protein ATCC90586_005593 [Pythium insidiosum]
MGSYLSVVNDTSDTWQCKVGPDMAALKVAGIIITALGVVASVIATAGGAAPLATALSANGVISVFGVSTSAMVAITAAAAKVSTLATVLGTASGFGIAVAKGVSEELNKRGHRTLTGGEKQRWGKMTLSLWQQSECVKTVIVDPRTVRTETVFMRPIFSGATANANKEHSIQHWVSKKGVDSKTIQANNEDKSRSLDDPTEAAEDVLLIYSNGSVMHAVTHDPVDVEELS